MHRYEKSDGESEDIYSGLAYYHNLAKRLGAERDEALYRAGHDELTGLLNKASWIRRIEKQIEIGGPFGVIFMDIDQFKHFNDQRGHIAGDKLLSEFGSFLREKFRRPLDEISHEGLVHSTGAGRYGGDEFGLLVGLEVGGPRRASSYMEELANTVTYLHKNTEEFAQFWSLDFDVSIGAVVWLPGPFSSDATGLLRQADQAMYNDKVSKTDTPER